MTRLELHKRRFELEERRGELIRLEELTGDELVILNNSFFERIRQRGAEDLDEMYSMYVGVLHEWGVMCPHPMDRREYSWDGRWYDCSLCNAAVIG